MVNIEDSVGENLTRMTVFCVRRLDVVPFEMALNGVAEVN